MRFIYVTEPEVIDIEAAQAALQDPVTYTVVAGDTTFSGSNAQPFDTLLIRSGTHIDTTVTQHFPQLKHIVRVGVGLDNVDLEFCKHAGIAVYNAPGANADAVAEYTVLMVLYVLRNVYLLDAASVAQWQRTRFVGRSISELCVGIVGLGNVGRRLQTKLRGLGCTQFRIYDPYLPADLSLDADTTAVSLDELLSQSDIVSLHLPLTPETQHIINATKLGLLKDKAILVNAARGGIVDEQAVLDNPDAKHLTYIADVIEGEPHVNPQLLEHTNIIITPHIASLTDASEKAMLEIAIANFLRGAAVKNA